MKKYVQKYWQKMKAYKVDDVPTYCYYTNVFKLKIKLKNRIPNEIVN